MLRLNIIVILLVVTGVLSLGRGGYIAAKAELAQYLIKTSWQQSLASHKAVKPWSWADTWPVARITATKYKVDLIVLAGDSGRTLAFGPGYRFGTTIPGDNGNSIISAHRDTHFKFLQYLVFGDELLLQNQTGQVHRFRVVDTQIVDVDNATIPIDYDESVLTLVTCYPFNNYPFNNSVPGGRLRYLVTLVETSNFRITTALPTFLHRKSQQT